MAVSPLVRWWGVRPENSSVSTWTMVQTVRVSCSSGLRKRRWFNPAMKRGPLETAGLSRKVALAFQPHSRHGVSPMFWNSRPQARGYFDADFPAGGK
jgi:hypothetical protein